MKLASRERASGAPTSCAPAKARRASCCEWKEGYRISWKEPKSGVYAFHLPGSAMSLTSLAWCMYTHPAIWCIFSINTYALHPSQYINKCASGLKSQPVLAALAFLGHVAQHCPPWFLVVLQPLLLVPQLWVKTWETKQSEGQHVSRTSLKSTPSRLFQGHDESLICLWKIWKT